MSQDACKPQCNDQKDPKKAVELSIVILVDNDNNNEEKGASQSTPSPTCPPPCCTPCCMPMPCCYPPYCPCMRSPCGGQQQQQQALPCPSKASTTTCQSTDKVSRSICVDIRSGKTVEKGSCANLTRTQSTISCQTAPCQSTTASCQTLQAQPDKVCSKSMKSTQAEGGEGEQRKKPCKKKPKKKQDGRDDSESRSESRSRKEPSGEAPDAMEVARRKSVKEMPLVYAPEPTSEREPTPVREPEPPKQHKHHHHKKPSEEKPPAEEARYEERKASGERKTSGERRRSSERKHGEKKGSGESHHHHHRRSHGSKRSSGASSRRASIPAEQIDFTHCSDHLTFVKYFLKWEGGAVHVTNLAENKNTYERESKQKLSKFPKHIRYAAQEYFMKIVDTINTPTPDTQHTEIKHFHVMKYLHPVLTGLGIDMPHESHAIHRYHNYILSVVKIMEERVKSKEIINPACLVEVETQLLAGIVCRFFPVFIRVKDEMINLIKQGKPNEKLPPNEFLKELKKLLLCVYVEIACIDASFTNTLTSMGTLPSVAAQDSIMQQLAERKKHARHATKWAARCLATTLLFYFMIDM